ncbi:hypothetical protein [Acinetobacter brisouii]|uniref:XRE family transcriptional regulator n=1 Tax=Acinetobacter brisouii CIP 110357 TaxID=1341683 RepID=V2US45_9GAMM|nr:hypothetical protein [Acinetobacter brisouii]ENV46809.1 hypothetical protein F954_02799 [Acinetobacter brisouii ANC 4119]ESK52797.1 hypothetical protein P255_00959 [Acinetobacter brisouii CIP 110357]
MTVDDLKTFYQVDSDAALARKLKRNRSVIHYWKHSGIPEKTQSYFEVLSKRKLKADLNIAG